MAASAREAFADAAFALVGPAPLRARLVNAWVVHLDRLHVERLPPRHRLGFVELRDAMTAAPEGISDDDAWRLARWVVSAALELEAAHATRRV